MPSELVNSVMSKPQPPRPRMTRRNSVSVTPAIGASTAAGRSLKSRILYSAGNINFSVMAGPSPGKTQRSKRAKGIASLLVRGCEREILQEFFQAQEFAAQGARIA